MMMMMMMTTTTMTMIMTTTKITKRTAKTKLNNFVGVIFCGDFPLVTVQLTSHLKRLSGVLYAVFLFLF